MGVANKIKAQAAALAAAGAPVTVFSPAGGRVMRDDAVVKDYGGSKLKRRLVHYYSFYTAIAAHPGPVVFLYIRYQRTSPAFLWMLRRLKKKFPELIILVEFPSFPYHREEVTLRDRFLGISDRLLRRFLQQTVDFIVTFSKKSEILGIPTIQTDNGTDVNSVAVLPRPPSDGPIRLLGLANLSFWHGYDRVLSGLAEYRNSGGMEEVVFEIVGTGNELERLKSDAMALDLGRMVNFHGPKRGDALTAIMAQCHIGISSIGMHRLQVDTSNLKSREFCAHGLPFVIAYSDRDFEGFRFCYDIPSNDTPVDVFGVIDFFRKLSAETPDYRWQMRRFAEERLTWSAKMAPVVQTVMNLATERS